MKTKKYKKLVEDNGYRYYENNYSITARKYSEEHYDIEIKVGKLRPRRLEVTIKGFCGDESDMILAAMELAETPPEDREEECAMTSFFKQKIEELGFQTRDNGENYIVANMDGNLIAIISKNVRKQINTNFDAWEELSVEKKDMLFDLFIRFTSTPPEDRSEITKTKEFIKRVEEVRYNVTEGTKTIDIIADGFIIATVWKNRIYAVNIFFSTEDKYANEDKLFDLIVDYVKIPIEDREKQVIMKLGGRR